MEFLVTMTTTVPAGTTSDEVADMRAREAANTRTLARRGRVRRLWRPPLLPGEWRSIGLFDAADGDDLESTLATMPLRAWRTDEVTALGTHRNDPGPGTVPLAVDTAEYLVTLTVDVPAGTPAATVADAFAREAVRAHELAAEGRLLRLWTLPGDGRNIGLWQASDDEQLRTVLRGLPLADWLTTGTVPLTRHPSDPADPPTPVSAGPGR